ncbi:hypothetical protein N7472_006986 [Penicillium cf. griseofulvum]|uniref:Uncharacterized protein n=1 Tax=Penicillium cf. griseofulvum TaxID=2972120 RepID=A0A9W9M5G6_9EURO|nr:hypothetical protein N7472_006986 [Penicillium cf. griseofulvum]
MRHFCCSLICCGRSDVKSPVQPIIRLVPDEEEEPKVEKSTRPQKVVEKAPRSPKAKLLKPLKPLKPAKVQKPASPKKKVKPQKKATSGSEANSSDEEYSLPSPPLHGYRTGITPEMSGVDLNSAEYSDIEVEETSPGDGLSVYPPEVLLNSPLEQLLTYSTLTAQQGMELGKSSPSDSLEVLPLGPESGKEPSYEKPEIPIPGTESSGASSFYLTKKDNKLSTAKVAAYRAQGAQLQRWLEDPNEPNCDISPITTTINDLFNAPSPRNFELGRTNFGNPYNLMDGGEPESVGLVTTGDHYRYITISNPVTDPKVLEAIGREHASNSYAHTCGPGLLVAHSIFRYDNFLWNEIGRAVYTMDRPINTLKYIMFIHVINDETRPYIEEELYPRLGLCFDIQHLEPCQKIERGTPEYKELLGTKLGKAAAILLISSLPRGSRRIARAVIWNFCGKIMLRFEVESTTDEEIPGGPEEEAPEEAPEDSPEGYSYASGDSYEESEGW